MLVLSVTLNKIILNAIQFIYKWIVNFAYHKQLIYGEYFLKFLL